MRVNGDGKNVIKKPTLNRSVSEEEVNDSLVVQLINRFKSFCYFFAKVFARRTQSEQKELHDELDGAISNDNAADEHRDGKGIGANADRKVSVNSQAA